jgi:putative aldouronate transport system permease protein
MWAWGTWKGLGWSAIIYISAISGIDQQLYEAATVDGAGRFQKMWHVTLPGLLPTFIVLLVMSIAGILSNGMDQYLVFSNASTIDKLNVLDLYVYKLVFDGNGLIPLSTVIGMAKSIISIILLFIANTASKAIRGSGII